MKLRFIILGVFVATLAACHSAMDPLGYMNDSNRRDDLAGEGERGMSTVYVNSKDLRENQGIDLGDTDSPAPKDQTEAAKNFDWTKISPDYYEHIREELNTIVRDLIRVREIREQKNVAHFYSYVRVDGLLKNADLFRKSLAKHMEALKQASADKSP